MIATDLQNVSVWVATTPIDRVRSVEHSFFLFGRVVKLAVISKGEVVDGEPAAGRGQGTILA